MADRYLLTRTEKVAGSNLINVYFSYGLTNEGNVTVPEAMLGTAKLDMVIQLQLDRLQSQVEQLAAGD